MPPHPAAAADRAATIDGIDGIRMGYNLYITRANSWLDTKKVPISKLEWESVVASDPSLKLSTQDYYDRMMHGKIERVHPVLWTSQTDQVPLWFIDGAIDTKNPDKATTIKMVELARRLNAKVLGEEDEEYGMDGEPLPRS
jgi:hypothetical protein